METKDVDQAQKLLDQIAQLQSTLKASKEEGERKFEKIKVDEVLKQIPIKDGKLDQKKWEELSEEEKSELLECLRFIRDSLYIAAGLDGPKDPNHIMYAGFASNKHIYFLLFYSLAFFIVLITCIVLLWDEATGPKDLFVYGERLREGVVFFMVILMGGLGGTMHLIRSMVMFVGNRRFKRSWILYYLSMPFSGAGLAPLVYLLLRVGLVSPTGQSGGDSTISNLNPMAIYAVAALTGLFAKTALDKMHEVFKVLFQTHEPSSKDKLQNEKKTGAHSGGTNSGNG